nr:MAG TPA: hypothetical protein [Caudoviricetes sp.]
MPVVDHNATYQFMRFSVAGVTFKNGRRSRQTILREIFWKDESYKHFDGERSVGPKLSEVDGQPAVEIWVQGDDEPEMIGYVPKEELPFVLSHWELYAGVTAFEVYGGGKSASGEKISFGASLTMRFGLTDAEKAEKAEEIKKQKEENEKLFDRAARASAAIQDRAEAEKRAEAARKQAEAEEKEKQKKNKIIAAGIIVAVIVLLKLLVK